MSLSDELLQKLKPLQDRGLIQIGNDAAAVNLIEQRFPFSGSKIDWDAVSGSLIKKQITGEAVDECRSFLDDCLRHMDASTQLVIVGDSAMDFSIMLRLADIAACIDEVIQLPQHTYITTPKGDWCIVFTMEGDMCFGYAPPTKKCP